MSATDRVPADQGLSTLALLMQLFGTLFGAIAAALFTLFAFTSDQDEAKTLMLVGFALSGVRSWFHVNAGAQLLYSTKPRAGLRRYIVVAIAHTIAMIAIDIVGFEAPLRLVIATAAGLLVWPIALAVVMTLPRFARFFKAELPLAEDKGFEGLAIIMSILGACGTIEWGAILIVLLFSLRELLGDLYGVLLVVCVVGLFVRSYLHVTGGLAGVRDTNFARSVRTGNRYSIVGIAASFIVVGVLYFIALREQVHIVAYPLIACLGWMLLAWPLIVRRFVGHRQLASLAENDTHERSPDAGLTNLGWILIASAMMTLSVLVPDLIAGPSATGTLGELLQLAQKVTLVEPTSIGWNFAIVAVELWAGIELVRMSDRFRIAATAYALVCGAWTAYHSWPQMSDFAVLRTLAPEDILPYVPLATNLVMPIATLLLVRRSSTPTAIARFRS